MYDCIIVGGGIAGLQASIQLGRYRRMVLLIDRGDGRSAICRNYHNVLGYPEGVSGQTLRELGRRQAASYGVEIIQGDATEAARRKDGSFTITCCDEASDQKAYEGRTVLLATGVMDRIPVLDGLRPALGLTVFVCPDCDGFETEGKRTVVLGSGNTGAHMALTLTYFCNTLTYVNHEKQPIDEHVRKKLKEAGIVTHDEPIKAVLLEGAEEEGRFSGVKLASGETVSGERGFIAFGGNEVRSDLARQLHVERLENRHIMTDPRSKMTNVAGVWAAGDVAVHSEQLTIAMGEGQQAAIWMHKWLLAREKEDAQALQKANSLQPSGAT
jgi:thioredoxin reductase (NADPH)